MRAWTLSSPKPIEQRPLVLQQVPIPQPGPGEVRIRVHACAMCRTDLHTIEGEIPTPVLPITPGHQVIGTIDQLGDGVNYLKSGERVGIPWLGSTCGECSYCRSNRENLCDRGRFTGQHIQGGYAEFMIARGLFVYPIARELDDLQAAPLLCSGVIGYRALKLAQLPNGGRLGLYGFGSSAHLTLQLASAMNAECYVITRGDAGQEHARALGAKWAGGPADTPPKPLDSIIIFAAAGDLIPTALSHLVKGGQVVCAGIHMSDIPAFPYASLWGERAIRSVANSTRADVRELLELAAKYRLSPKVTEFSFDDMNANLLALKNGRFVGTGVVRITNN